jgi:carbonic anhydrase/acetyltransferase-like protein (isoleucine patch superfamily)
MIYALGDIRPQVDLEHVYVAPNATVIGDVYLGRGVSVWWNAVLRGDNDPIRIGAETNIQDGCVAHADPGFPLTIGARVTVGHMVMIHGCTIGDDVLVGIGSVVLNGAKIGSGSLIGAKALITEGKEIPPNSIVMGVPAKIVGEVSERHRKMIAAGVKSYVNRAKVYRESLSEVL